MKIKWKNKTRFKPDVILKKIDAIRTVDSDGKVSFAAFEIEYCLPALHSMLEFPRSASEITTSELIWRSLAKVEGHLTPESFLETINAELKSGLAKNIQTYSLLTTISLDSTSLPRQLKVNGSEIRFLRGNHPSRFVSRNELLQRHRIPIPDPPSNYCKVIVTTQAKTPAGATNTALRSLDLIRSVWCLLRNPRMQITFGHEAISPINVIRLGSKHTLHLPSGASATDIVWFEPGFRETDIVTLDSPTIFRHASWALRQIASSAYRDTLTSALIRYVRALDESDPNTAFIRLWGALEVLAIPGQADYGKLVSRCTFLYKDTEFHRQLLEHLREYRNTNIHAGEESEQARTHCFQLQIYFTNLIWFHLRNAKYFQSIDEATSFLDSPLDLKQLSRRSQLIRKAFRYRGENNAGSDSAG